MGSLSTPVGKPGQSSLETPMKCPYLIQPPQPVKIVPASSFSAPGHDEPCSAPQRLQNRLSLGSTRRGEAPVHARGAERFSPIPCRRGRAFAALDSRLPLGPEQVHRFRGLSSIACFQRDLPPHLARDGDELRESGVRKEAE